MSEDGDRPSPPTAARAVEAVGLHRDVPISASRARAKPIGRASSRLPAGFANLSNVPGWRKPLARWRKYAHGGEMTPTTRTWRVPAEAGAEPAEDSDYQQYANWL